MPLDVPKKLWRLEFQNHQFLDTNLKLKAQRTRMSNNSWSLMTSRPFTNLEWLFFSSPLDDDWLFCKIYRMRCEFMRCELFCTFLKVVCAHDSKFVQCKDACALGHFFHPKVHTNFANANIWHCTICHWWILSFCKNHHHQMLETFCQSNS